MADRSRANSTRTTAPRIIALANQKGGVGKTTTAINLGAGLAANGARTLIIDMDPQGNASTGLGLYGESRVVTSYDVMMGQASLDAVIQPTSVDNLHLTPATVDLSGAEVELIGEKDRLFRLRNALRGAQAGGALPYDFVLIDCPPSLTMLTVNALTAADSVLVPLQCEFFALEGLSQLLNTIQRIRSSLNPRLEIHGVLLTMFDRRNNLSEQVARDVREYLGDKVFETIIPRNVRISEAPSHGKPALAYDRTCAGSRAYFALANEMLRREVNPPRAA